MIIETRRQRYFRRLNALESERTRWQNQWEDVSEYVVPTRGLYVDDIPNRGERKSDKIINPTATEALGILASGMQAGLTSPAMPWLKLGLERSGANEIHSVREWLQTTQEILYQAMAKSGFYPAVHTAYGDEGSFGCALIYEEETPEDGISFRCFSPGTYSLIFGASGKLNGVYRRCWMTARQVEERFGLDRASSALREAASNTPDKWFELVHAVEPRKQRDPRRGDSTNLPFSSVYLEKGASEADGRDGILSEGGYHEMPFFAPRWTTNDHETYGRSPAMTIIGTIKMLQQMEITSVEAIHKTVDPPLRMPEGFRTAVNTFPGGINYLSGDEKSAGPLYQVNYDYNGTEAKIQRIEEQIRRAFHNHVFLTLVERPNMTATEVLERTQEKMQLLGPVIDSQIQDLLEPMIDRTFGILWRAGEIPEPPEEIMGMPLKVEYIGPLALARRKAAVEAIGHITAYVGNMAAFDPKAMDKLDIDEAIDQQADMLGVPPKVIRSDDQVAEIRAIRQQEIAQQQAMAEAMTLTQGAKDLGSIKTGERNALTDIAGAME